ncbi:MAG: sigma-54-dependent Fis family transcriptional regulator [Myxococcales bacterium]|nr:sigma-54-dependent Fis family transcriptional regulator [Myxococcales bacterium]
MELRLSRVLVVDDEENIRHMLGAVLRQEGRRVTLAASADEALDELSSKTFDVMISDIRMPDVDGLELLSRAHAAVPELVVIMMSAYGSVDTALEAMRRGAYDYIAKPFKPAEVSLLLRKAEERERLKEENKALRTQIQTLQAPAVGNMVARSDAMARIFKTVRKIAEYKTTLLIQGESGTGKELVAQAAHKYSPRALLSFVPVNCGAIPENLLESELFGHKKGAFTDATQDKKGLFDEAHEGTLFLDEVGELPLNLQVKLLRVLQEEEIRPVGDTVGRKVNVRVIAATVKNLEEEVAAGRFREDLFYRLNVLPITLPPLRERAEDIPPLVSHFIKSTNVRLGINIQGISQDAMRLLLDYRWPGNVRELENTIEHAMVLAEGDQIDVDTLPAKVREGAGNRADTLLGDTLSIKKASRIIEERLIRRALEQTGGNRTAAAKLLEISHRALLYKIKAYEITDL